MSVIDNRTFRQRQLKEITFQTNTTYKPERRNHATTSRHFSAINQAPYSFSDLGPNMIFSTYIPL